MTALEQIGPTANGHLHQLARQQATALTHRANGLEDAGQTDLARECRLIATMLLETLDQLEAERSVRRTLQKRCDEYDRILGKAAYQACENAAP
jgi:hypothetical protein